MISLIKTQAKVFLFQHLHSTQLPQSYFVQINGAKGFTPAAGTSYVGKWVVVAMTYDAATKTVTTYQGFEDSYTGLLGSTILPSAGEVQDNTLDATIGYRTSFEGRALDGNLSDFRIYNEVLNAAMIADIYTENLPAGPIVFETKNAALLNVPVEPQEVYAIANRDLLSHHQQ